MTYWWNWWNPAPANGWIKGRYTVDADGNDNEWNDETGQWDGGVEGKTIKLLDLHGNVVATSVTDHNGNYMFDVAPGDYRVQFPTVDGFSFSAKDSGVDEHFDSDADANGLTDVIHVQSHSTIQNVDAGIKQGAIDPDLCITIEAEDMHAYNFFDVHGSQASGGELVKLCHSTGDLWTDFHGPSSCYDITLYAQDENDGCSEIMVKVNGHVVDTVTLHRNTDGGGSDHGGFSQFTISNVDLEFGDKLQLWAKRDGGEYVRIDKLELKPCGPKGEIEGRVFCDLDCDGIDGTVAIVDGDTKVWEAEHMHKYGFFKFHGSHASNGKGVKLGYKKSGDLTKDFDGESGTYDLNLFVQDESDGQSTIMVKVNGNVVKTITLDGDNNGGGSDHAGFSNIAIDGVDINNGDKITIWAQASGGEFVRIDKLEFTQKVEEVTPEPGKEGVLVKLLNADGSAVLDDNGNAITTTTAADGSYKFTGVADGDYKVMFVAPNGQEFTLQDVGGNDAIDSDVGAGGMSGVITVAGDTVTDVDAGLKEIKLGAISGRYFCDTNDNDLDDGQATDPGIAGVVVTLVETGATVETGPNGEYTFADVPAGTYTIEFSDPNGVLEGKQLVAPNANGNANDDIDSDAVGDTTLSTISGVNVVAGEESANNDAGAEDIPLGSISGKYFDDVDRDGFDNDGANGVEGILVELLDENGFPTGDSTTTLADGSYSFGGLTEGTYGVKFTDPDTGRVLTTQNADGNANDDIDSDAGDVGGGMSTIEGIVVVGGQDTPNNDAGVVDLLGSLSGRYFMDTNDNDLDDGQATDPGIEGVLVTLVETGATVETGPNGEYSFTGTCRLATTRSSSRTRTVCSTASSSSTPNVDGDVSDDIDSDAVGDTTLSTISGISVVGGQDTPNNDAGAEDSPGSISGRYFCDTNDNDLDDGQATDPGVQGVTVLLLDENQNPLGPETTTGPNGEYSFSGLPAGTYSIGFRDDAGVLDGKTLITPNVNGNANDDIDSDAIVFVDPTISFIPDIVVVAGQDTPNNDAGVEDLPPEPGSLSGRYFMDTNDNDLDDGQATDPGIEGVLVTLVETGATVETGPNGEYSFTGLAAGDYTVEFSDPNGVLDGKQRCGLPAGDYTVEFSDPNGVLDGKQLVAPNVNGNANDDIDSDAIGDTTLSTIAGITVVEGQDTPDNDAGAEDIPPQPGSLSGRYFMDTNDNDLDDGQATDPGIEGVLVTLVETGDTVETGPNGEYSFTGLPAGDYTVEFSDPNGVLDGKQLVAPNVNGNANDDIDSDAIGDTTLSTIAGITVVEGQDTPDNDAGAEDIPNTPPTPGDDTAEVCADEVANIPVFFNDSDPDGDTTSITAIDGQSVVAGDTVVLANGVEVTLNADGSISVDGTNSQEVIDLGIDDQGVSEELVVSFTYELSDGQDTGTANVDVTFKGAYETPAELLADLQAALDANSGGEVCFELVQDELGSTDTFEGGFDMRITGAGDARLDGVIAAAYCIGAFDAIDAAFRGDGFDAATDLKGTISFLDDSTAFDNPLTTAMTMDLTGKLDNIINYILNNDYTSQDNGDGGTYTDAEVQGAIWGLTDSLVFVAGNTDANNDGFPDPDAAAIANAQEILNDAIANGKDFQVGEGDIVGLVIDPTQATIDGGHEQPFVIGVEWVDCICPDDIV